MTRTDRLHLTVPFAVICIFFCLALIPVARAEDESAAISTKGTAASLMQRMVGTWSVQQRMWTGPGTEPVNLPPAVAHRHMVEDTFLEEVMELAAKSGERFTRIACFNYNVVNQQYEYFSLDSRAPQMMIERSLGAGGQGKPDEKSGITLYGGSFVAPRWGEAKNVAFMYRLTVGEVKKDRQVVRLYLTQQSGQNAKEFLAFEYVYTRQR